MKWLTLIPEMTWHPRREPWRNDDGDDDDDDTFQIKVEETTYM